MAARRDGARAAADAHAEAVQPLRGEVARMHQALGDLQGAYSQDMDRVSHLCLVLLPACSAATPARSWRGACQAPATFGAFAGNGLKVPLLVTRACPRSAATAVQVRHAAEDQVSAARQEAQRAIRDLQTAASRLQVPQLLTPGQGSALHCPGPEHRTCTNTQSLSITSAWPMLRKQQKADGKAVECSCIWGRRCSGQMG